MRAADSSRSHSKALAPCNERLEIKMPTQPTQGLMKPELWSGGPLEPVSARTPRMNARWIVRPRPEGWDKYALSEWELTAAGYADHHPHDEVSYVLEGELHIRVDGTTAVGRPGDTILVPAGSTGYYWAPTYARMLGIYGPNAAGEATESVEYWEIDETSGAVIEGSLVPQPFAS